MQLSIKVVLAVACLMAAALPPLGAAHKHVAPHSGTLVRLGDEFAHVELMYVPKEGKLTLFVLDGSAAAGVRIPQQSIKLTVKPKSGGAEQQAELEAVANPLTGETAGDSSEFVAQSQGLRFLDRFDVVIASITVHGQAFDNVSFPFPEGNEGQPSGS